MSTTIDEKVVEMRFDNQQFEKNVSTTMSTLESLKKSLNFSGATKGLDNINSAAKSCDFSPLSSAVSSIQAKFSALDVIAIAALTNITNSAVNAGKQLVKSLSIDQVTAGWNKYAEETSAVQTLVNSTGKSVSEINAYLEKLMWYSDETSYGFTDMASALATMTSSGGDIDKLIPMIEGVANATAFAGKGAAEFTSLMRYGINQAYSLGYMQVQDWKSLETMTVNSKQLQEALIAAGEELGKIKKGEVTLQTFRSSLADKWLDKEVMELGFGQFSKVTEEIYQGIQDGIFDNYADGLEKIGDKYGEVALRAATSSQEAKTFGEAIAATQDAVSTGWLNTFKLIFGDYTQAKVVWTNLSEDLWEIFASGLKKRNALLESALGGNLAWAEISEKVSKAGVDVEAFQEKCIELGKKYGHVTDEMISAAGGFEASLSSGWLSRNIVSTALKSFVESGKEASAVTSEVTKKIEDLDSVVKQVLSGGFGNGAARVEALTAAGYDYATVQTLVNKALGDNTVVAGANLDNLVNTTAAVEELSDAELKNLGFTEEQVSAIRSLSEEARKAGTSLGDLIDSLDKPTGRELLIGGLSNILHGLMGTMQAVREAWEEIFPPATARQVYNIVEKFNQLTQSLLLVNEETGELNDKGENLMKTFRGLFAALDIVRMVVGGPLTLALELFKELLSAFDLDILEFTASIGDSIVVARNWLKTNDYIGKAMRKLAGWIKNSIGVVKEWIDSFLALDEVQSVIRKLSNIFEAFKIDLSSYFQGGGAAIQEFIERCKKLDGISLKNLWTAMKDFWKNVVVGYFFNLDGKFENVQEALGSLLEKIGNAFKKLGQTIKDFFNGSGQLGERFSKIFSSVLEKLFGANYKEKFKMVSDLFEWLKEIIGSGIAWITAKLKSFDLGDLLWIAAGAGVVAAVVKILKVLDMVIAIVGGFADGVATFLTGISKGVKRALTGAAVLEIAIAIAVLAEAIARLAAIDSTSLDNALDALALLASIIAGLMLVVEQMQRIAPMGAEKLVLAMVGVAAAMFLLTMAFIQLDKIDFKHPGYTFTALGIMLFGLLMAVHLLSKVGKVTSPWQILSVVAIAAALWIMVDAFKRLDAIDFKHYWKTLFALGTLCAGLYIVGKSLSGVTFGGAAGAIAIVLALWLLVGVVKKLDKLDLENPGLVIIRMIALILVIKILLKAMQNAGANAGSAGLGILGAAAGMFLLVEVIKKVADIRPADIIKGFVVIGVLTLFVGLLMNFSKHTEEAKPVKTGLMILMIAGAMLLLVAAIKMLSSMSVEELAKGTIPLVVLAGIFAGLMYVSKFAQASKSTIILIIGTIAAITIAVKLLADIEDPERLRGAVEAISIIAGVMAALALVAGLIKIDWKTMGTSLILMIGILAAIMAAITGAIYILCTYTNVDQAIGIAQSLAILIGALSWALAACAIVGVVGAGAFIGLGVMLGLMALFGAAIAAIVWIGESMKDNEKNLHELLDEYLPLLGDIGYAIGDFFRSIIGGFAEGLTSGLPEIGENLASFCDSVANIPDGAANKVGEIASALIQLKKIKNCKFENLDGNLEAVGTAIAGLAGSLSGVEDAELKKATDVLTALGTFAGSLKRGIFTGKTGLGSFAGEMAEFGEALTGETGFVAAVGSLEDGVVKKVETAITIGTMLSDFAKTLEVGGGIAQMLSGETGLATFAEEMATFGTNAQSLAESVKDLTDDNVTHIGTAITIADKLSAFSKTIEIGEGWWQKLSGGTGLGAFATEMGTFGTNVISLAENIKDISKRHIQKVGTAVSIGEQLADFAKNLPDPGDGWWQKLTGTSGLGAFAGEMKTFGKKVKDLGDNLELSDNIKDNVQLAIDCGNLLVDFTNTLTGFDPEGNLTSFSDNIYLYGDAILAFCQTIEQAGMTNLDMFATSFAKISEVASSDILTYFSNANGKFQKAGKNIAYQLILGFENSVGVIDSAVSTVLTNITTAINNGGETISTASQQMSQKLAGGFRQGKSAVVSSAKTIIYAVKNAFREQVSAFYQVGQNYVYGVGNGISDTTWYARQKASYMASQIVDATQKALKERSPSKIGYQIGEFFAMPIADALYDWSDRVGNAGANLGNAAVQGVSKAIAAVAEAVSSDMDTTPVIRPVLDLSDVRSQAGTIGALLNRQQAMSISAGMNTPLVANQNGDAQPASFSFTQNNYSPKALSSIDIYRQTKNQFSALKGAVAKK